MSAKVARRERQSTARAVRAMLMRVLVGLRAILRARAPAYYEARPDAPRPCRTCAFNPGTDHDRGFDSTIWGLSRAIVVGAPFYCHDNQPRDATGEWTFDPRIAQRCAGYEVVMGDVVVCRRAVVRGMLDLPGLADDAKADAALEFVQDLMPCAPQRKAAVGVTAEVVRAFEARAR